jgi:actin-related protein
MMSAGPKAQQYRGLMSIQYPMEHGIVTNWNDMEAVWQYCYSQEQVGRTVFLCATRLFVALYISRRAPGAADRSGSQSAQQ